MGKYLDIARQFEARLQAERQDPPAVQSQSAPSWPCPHCGQPAEVTDIAPSRDGTYRLTFWHCEPCQGWAVTPSDLREPPVWVSAKVQ